MTEFVGPLYQGRLPESYLYLLLVATGGVPATLRLDNNGTIAGQNVYTLKPGTNLLVSFDGTNLS
jgi:hypothetical protein